MEPAGCVPSLWWLGDKTVVQSALNAHFLLKSLVNCSSSTIGYYPDIDSLFCASFGEIHLKAIRSCWVRQEASVLALRVIHSVTRTQRGPSSLVSLLLAFKECVCVHTKECERSCMHMSLFEHRAIPQVIYASCIAPHDQSQQACVRPRYGHAQSTGIATGKRLLKTSFYCTTHILFQFSQL